MNSEENPAATLGGCVASILGVIGGAIISCYIAWQIASTHRGFAWLLVFLGVWGLLWTAFSYAIGFGLSLIVMVCAITYDAIFGTKSKALPHDDDD